MRTLLPIFPLLLALAACSYHPEILPNDHLMSVSKEQSEKDIKECTELADTYDRDSEEWKRVAKTTAVGAVAGTAAGAVGGAIVSNAGRGAGIGAATGAVAAIVTELFRLGESDPSEKRFIDYCLEKRGYRVGKG